MIKLNLVYGGIADIIVNQDIKDRVK